jgi:hypothetical protein
MKRLRIHTEEIMSTMGWSRKHSYKIMRIIRDCYPNSKKYVREHPFNKIPALAFNFPKVLYPQWILFREVPPSQNGYV